MNRRDPVRPAARSRSLSVERWTFILLASMALLCVAALDFLGARQGRPAYFFRTAEALGSAPEAKALTDAVLEGLAAGGVGPDAVRRVADSSEFTALNVRLARGADYAAAAAALDRAVEAAGGRTTAKDESTTDLDAAVHWKIRAKGRRVEVLFTWPLTAPQAAAPEEPGPARPEAAAVTPGPDEAAVPRPDPGAGAPAREPARRPEPGRTGPRTWGQVALVIDDMGYSLEALDALLALKRPLTVSILPFSPHAAETARRARTNGFDVLLHLPLESLNGSNGSPYTEGLIRASMSEAEIRASLADQLNRVPFISGVNNHMGSLVTSDPRLMGIILAPLRERGLFFLDSRTIGRSIAYQEARRLGLRAAARDVFLDDMADVKSVRERIRELVALARRTGVAVGIGHPYVETLQALREEFEALESQGVEAVTVSRVVR